MRKTIVFLLFLCFQLAVQAQTTYRYWFDIDESSMQEGVSNVDEWQMDIDVNDLTENIHQLHLQIADKDGTWSTIQTHWFVKAPSHASHGMYWFDENDKEMHRSDVLNGRFDIDVSMLTDGIHILTYQVRDTKNRPSAQYRTIFLKIPTPTKSKVHYWVDDESEKMQTFAYNGNTHILDLTGVSDGFHILHVQAEDISPSSPMTKLFIKIPQTEGVEKLLCLCSIDGETVKQEEVTNHDGVLNWSLDVSDITQGFHHILVQVITNSGAGSSLYEGFFLRDFTSTEMSSLKCVYSIDGEPHRTMTGSHGGDVFHFDLDVVDIKDGLHNITYMLVGDNGVCTKSNSAFFWKTPLGGNGVAQYNYWLNDQTEKHEVVLKERTNPYNLITLLPVDKMPVRSSCFDFKVENGAPVIYAKNDIHFEFIDASGFVNVANAQYVDPTVSKSIEGITALQPTQTFVRPEENSIKWFMFDAAPGDTIGFKASQATSVQVFAPSGKEILSTMGDKSVQYSGAHTWEEGTYYVAVHDVTGSKPGVTLDYMHMDKYDVVDQDVRVVGNGGCSTITFQGNGFKDLYAVDLKDSKGDIIVSENVGHESDAKTSVRFNFTNVPLGTYDAVFHFTEDDKIIKSLVEVEDAKEIEIQLKTSYAGTFLRGTANTYTIRITNTGNSTAYQVPLKLQLQADGGIKDISAIKMSDNIPVNIPSFMEEDSVPQNVKDEIQHIIASYDGMLHFMKFRDASGDEFMEGYFALDLPPNSTYELSVSVKSNSRIVLFTQIPSSWFFYAYNENAEHNAKRVLRKSEFRDNACCSRDHVECMVDVVVNGLDFASLGFPNLSLASCLASLGNTVFKTSYDIWCGEAPNKDAFGTGSFISGLVATAASCLPDRLDPQKWAAAYRFFYDIFSTGLSCATTLNPNITPDFKCPPDPPKPHPSNPVNSFDPNDIYGYTHESGSKFISDSLRNVYYRIEFENDTTFATTSAHVVEVKDTLDSKYFDLATFAPTSVKIGDKVEYLDGMPNFVKTVDMRPAINAIAQVEGKYDAQKGIATWTFTSLDPMTMEPTDDVMQGFLPVNYDGVSGIGEVSFDINRKAELADGEEIHNRASITFDANEPILTPIWTNIVDAVAPISEAIAVDQKDEETAMLTVVGTDERSGVWKYDVYVQYGTKAEWYKAVEAASPDEEGRIDVRIYEGIDHGFYVCAIDSAGNVEMKEPVSEIRLDLSNKIRGDVNGDGKVTVADAVATMDYYLRRTEATEEDKRYDINRDGNITVADAIEAMNIYLTTK